MTTSDPTQEQEPTEHPQLADESRWYAEHTALLISTLKWVLTERALRAGDAMRSRARRKDE